MHARTLIGTAVLCGAALGAAWSTPALLAQAPAQAQAAQDHQLYGQADVQAGAKLYTAQCAQCHGASGDQITGVDFRRGVFRRSVSDDDLAAAITKGVAGTGMPPFSLQPAEVTALIAYIRAGFDPTAKPIRIGNAARGQALFEGKAACSSCHRVSGRGPRTAPDLTDVGAARAPDALMAHLLEPSSRMLPINRPVRVVMKDGRAVAGRRLNEDTYTVQLIDSQERLLSLAKSDIRTLTVETVSPMPSYANRLTQDELADVLAYLLTLKG